MIMRKVKLSEEIAVQNTLRKLIKTNEVKDEGEGVIDFNYAQFMDASNGSFSSGSEVSIVLNALVAEGKIQKIRKGTQAYPSRWNVGQFIGTDIATGVQVEVEKTSEPKAAVIPAPKEVHQAPTPTLDEVIAEEETQEVSSDDQLVTIGEVRETVRGMAEFLAETQNEMIKELNNMVARLTISDPERMEALEAQIMAATAKFDQVEAENRRLLAEVESAQAAIANAVPETKINKHVIYRNRNQILDEMERWINTPGWQKQSKAEYFKKSISTKLGEIIREAGVEENV